MTIFSYCPRLYSIKSRRKNDLNPPRSFDHETSHTPSDRMGRRFVGRNPSFMWSKSCPNLQHLDDALIPGRVVALLEQSKRQTMYLRVRTLLRLSAILTSDRDCKRIPAKLLDWPDHSHEQAELKSATAICRVLKEAHTEEGVTNANFMIQKRNPTPNQHDRGYHRGENKPAPAPAPGRGHQPAPPPPPPPPHPPSPPTWYTPTPTHTVLP
ncbi:hypothetical protein D6D18_09897 [Aureobasidium pullulans]|nr:hypothetical protein D6D18_09897 [Aureobasidium pullulans]